MNPYIECNNISKVYPIKPKTTDENSLSNPTQLCSDGFEALKDINFSLQAGDVLGVIGLNGAGKSTLLKIISEVIKPTSGSIKINGKIISVLEQQLFIVESLDCIENIRIIGSILGYKDKHIESLIPQILDYSGLQFYKDLPVFTLSNGMKLRLAFGIIWSLETDILILDEALTVGDFQFRNKIRETFEKLINNNKIVIIASHNMNEITEWCNKCLLLNYGKSIFYGDVETAVSMFYAQNKGGRFDFKKQNIIDFIDAKILSKKDYITTEDSFDLVFQFEVLNNKTPISVILNIFNSIGPVLTDSPLFRKEQSFNNLNSGKYEYRVTIPSYIFNIGSFNVSLIFGNINEDVYFRADSCTSFTIVPSEWEKDRIWSKMSLHPPIKIPLNWELISL